VATAAAVAPLIHRQNGRFAPQSQLPVQTSFSFFLFHGPQSLRLSKFIRRHPMSWLFGRKKGKSEEVPQQYDPNVCEVCRSGAGRDSIEVSCLHYCSPWVLTFQGLS